MSQPEQGSTEAVGGGVSGAPSLAFRLAARYALDENPADTPNATGRARFFLRAIAEECFAEHRNGRATSITDAPLRDVALWLLREAER